MKYIMKEILLKKIIYMKMYENVPSILYVTNEKVVYFC